MGAWVRGGSAAAAGVLASAATTTLLFPASAFAATIQVNTNDDVVNPLDQQRSLREAITAANTDAPSGVLDGECDAGGGIDTVAVPADDAYLLSIAGSGEDANATGHLDITEGVVVQGDRR